MITAYKDNQEIFDIVWKYFIIEKHEQSRKGNSCKYRLDSESEINKCGIGCLIPDELYNPYFDNPSGNDAAFINTDVVGLFFDNEKRIEHLKKKDKLDIVESLVNVKKLFLNTTHDFLYQIQAIHDSYKEFSSGTFHDHIKPRLIKVASTYNLVIPE